MGIFGPKRDEIRGEWKKLHNVELNYLYSPNIVWSIKSRRIGWVENVVRMRDRRDVCRVLVVKPEGRRTFGKPRRRWEANIKMELQ
jgi:hypothetical protein